MYIYQIMSNNFNYIDIILLGMIAGFIILRLRNVLGRKTGHQDKVFTKFTEKEFKNFKKEVNIEKEEIKENGLEGAQKEQFLKGAEIAYENIIKAFAKGNQKELKGLLSPEMSSNFNEAITQRNKSQITSELTFIGFKESKVEKFEKVKSEFHATVKFVCEIVSIKKNNENKIIEGDPNKIKTVTDYWKFTKSILSKSPNWHLCEIISK